MWEFSDPDLGYSYGQPVIAPISNGAGIDWYVIVANGYNAPSGGANDGQAQLFLIKLSGPGNDGVWDLNQDYYVISTGAQSYNGDNRNGLSAPQVVDYTGDYIADRVYAGDLFGNLWAFDLRNGAGGTTVAKLFTTIDHQPITSKPAVAYHPDMTYNDNTKPDLLVLFGSGQYLTRADKQTTSPQYLYGLWDRQADLSSATTIGVSDLVEQGPVSNLATGSGNYRVMTDPQQVAYADPGSPKLGWYLPLPDSGERVVNDPLVLGRVVYFATTTPLQSACDVGVSGWLMGLDLTTGSRTAQSVFDTNNDFHLNNSDRVTANGTSTVVSGQQRSGNLPQAPGNMGGNLYTPDSNGQLQASKLGDGTSGETDTLKRQSWRQLYYQRLK
jgi:type IV pilus assembly protein PilY1